jgi:hypothetical protein
VPVGKRVFLADNMRQIIYDIENVGNVWDHDMVNRTWEMREDGLTCIDCSGEESTVDGSQFILHDSDGTVKAGAEAVSISRNGKEVLRIDKNGVIIREEDKK